MVQNSDITNFCKYFLKYRTAYNEINGHHIGAFKKNNADFLSSIKTSANLDLDVATFTQFFDKAFDESQIKPEECTSVLYAFLTDIVAKESTQSYGQAHFSTDSVNKYSKFLSDMTASYSGLNIANPFSTQDSTQIITATLSQNITDTSANQPDPKSANDIPSDSQTLLNLEYLNQSSTLEEFFNKLESTLVSKLESAVQNKVSEEITKYLGINKNLTSGEVIDVQNKLGYTYQSILRKENQILLLQSHLKNNTSPDALRHHKFPAPFPAFDHKPLFIDNYNKIIETMQRQIMELEIAEFKLDIDNLNNDVRVFCNILSHHVQDIDRTKADIHNYQSDLLKKDFESAHVKVSKATRVPFTTNQGQKKSKKRSKQFDNEMKPMKPTKPTIAKISSQSKKAHNNNVKSDQTAQSRQHDNKIPSQKIVNYSNSNINSIPLLNTFPQNSFSFSHPNQNSSVFMNRNNTTNNQFFQKGLRSYSKK